ncbi:L,D-transpeptidase family protein [Sphingomonas daechungensis]|uniref:L,D-transpeptidase family protein n=1 Tax=Sphingomonas daechungensis TaxID=1176646 RepID=UPI0037837C6B
MRHHSLFLTAAALLAGAAFAQSNTAETNSAQSNAASANPAPKIDLGLLQAQVLLDEAGFSPGAIDGRAGSSQMKALRGFQQANGLPVTGKLDEKTKQALGRDSRPATVDVKLSAEDVGGPFTYPMPSKPEEQAKLDFLGYRNMLEKLAERYHTTPETIVALNGPEKLIGVGQTLTLPNVVPASREYTGANPKQAPLLNALNIEGSQPRGDYVVVDKSDGTLKVYEGEFPSESGKIDGKLLAQFLVTTGSSHDPLPLGNWKATTYSFLPPFNYQPDLFWDVSDDKAEHKLPPGPNGMVGVAWLDLTKEHYGIHGTPEPQLIGKTQSHGCLRMTNWDVMRLSLIMKPGFQAKFVA